MSARSWTWHDLFVSVSVTVYFEKRRSLATGLSMCGGGIGTIMFAPLIEILVDEYGWRGAALIVGGLVLNGCVFGALLRPLELNKQQQRQPLTDWSERALVKHSAPLYGTQLLSQNSSSLHSPPHTPTEALKHEGATVQHHGNEGNYIIILAQSTYTRISDTPSYTIAIGRTRYTVVTYTHVTITRG